MKVSDKLSHCLNRSVTESFVQVLATHAKGHALEAFITYAGVLGVNEDVAKDIYHDLKSAPLPAAQQSVVNNVQSPQAVKEKKDKKKNKINISYDDELEEIVPKKPKTIKFKKMKKEDALRFKQDDKPKELLDSIPKPEIKDKIQDIIQQNGQEKGEDPVTFDSFNETDEQWYIDDYEQTIEDKPLVKFQPKPIKTNHISGNGGFYSQGEYIDLDHESTPSISLTSHIFIPPFLDDNKDDLILQIGNNSIITFDAVKNHDGKLSMFSKNGSAVVNERRTQKERHKQAKERSDITGTRLGNILGIEQKVESNETVTKVAEEKIEKLTISEQRKRLPAYTVKNEVIKLIHDNQVAVIIGETGSGKTTQLTQFLYESGYKKIVCTQPRRVAAMSVAKRVSVEMGCKLGQEVGYSIRFEDVTGPNTKIKYMTEGILLREILGDSNLDNYDVVIIDEAHERTLSTDVLLGLLRTLVRKRRDLKVVITSATINADFFSEFFGGAPQFTIPGRTFPVDIHYNPSVTDYVEESVKTVIRLHLENLNSEGESDGDILVFMTGQEDIEVTCELIQEKLDQLNDIPPLEILPIYSSLPTELQSKIFQKLNKLKRKVVVATNIAETSLTVDGIKYVVDCGLIKVKIYNAKLGMDNLTVIPISIANGNQRSGRAGRTGPGKCYRLYSENEFTAEKLNVMPIPEIKRTNLSNVMLLLKSLKIKNIQDFPFIDPPSKELLSCSMYDLWALGALDNFGNLTNLGNKMISFPMEPSMAKLLIISTYKEFNCLLEIIIIVSMLSVPSVYYRPKERMEESDMMREKFSIKNSDHLTLLNIFNQWENQLKINPSRINQWCKKNFLNNKSLTRAKDIKNQLIGIMKSHSMAITSVLSSISLNDNDQDYEIIKKCLCMAFFPQLSRLSKINLKDNQIEYFNLRHSFMKLYLHPTSVINNSRDLPPEYVIYHQLILTKKEYMNCVTAVDPLWLVEYGYIFYDIPKSDRQKLGIVSMKDKFQKIIDDDKEKFHQVSMEVVKPEIKKFKKFKSRGV